MLAYEDALPCEVLRPVAPDRNPATAVFLWGRFGLRGIETLIAGSESGDRVFLWRRLSLRRIVLWPLSPDRNPATAFFYGENPAAAFFAWRPRFFYMRAADSPRRHRPIRRPRLQAQRGAVHTALFRNFRTTGYHAAGENFCFGYLIFCSLILP